MKIDGYDPEGKRTSVTLDDHLFAYLLYASDSPSQAKDYVRLCMRAYTFRNEGLTLVKSVTRDVLKVIVKPSLRRLFEDRDYQMDIEDY